MHRLNHVAQAPRSYSPRLNSSTAAENEIIDVETYAPNPLTIPESPSDLTYLHSLYQSPRHAQQMNYHYQQHQASSSAMGPPESSNTPVQPQTVNNGQSIAVAHDPLNDAHSMAIAQAPRLYSPRLNSSIAAENENIDVETYAPNPIMIPESPSEHRTSQTRDRLAKDAYRDQFKLATFTCKFTTAHGQQCGKTFPVLLSYLSRYQETSLFRENFDSISQDFK